MHEYKPSMILVVKMMMVVSMMVIIEEKKSSIWGNFRGHQIKPDAPCEMWKSYICESVRVQMLRWICDV